MGRWDEGTSGWFDSSMVAFSMIITTRGWHKSVEGNWCFNPHAQLPPFLLLFFNFTILYWYCHISKWIHHTYTCVPPPEPSSLLPPPSPYHHSGSSQCTSPQHPVSCIEPGRATSFIYYIIYVSMPFSQIIPPSPSPTESKRLFYTGLLSSLSLLTFTGNALNGHFITLHCCVTLSASNILKKKPQSDHLVVGDW